VGLALLEDLFTRRAQEPRVPAGWKTLKPLIPNAMRRLWWYVSDAEYRGRLAEQGRMLARRRALLSEAMDVLIEHTGGLSVLSGPFAGMVYRAPSPSACFPQKILGTYEKELWPIIEIICSRGYDIIVDIGAAEGYYVVGLARRLPECQVIAFEANANQHPMLQHIAQANGVWSQIRLMGFCTQEELAASIPRKGKCCIICDVEGFEAALLDPEMLAQLRECSLLVEVHDHLRDGVSKLLTERFEKSHQIDVIVGRPRSTADLPTGLAEFEQALLPGMDEYRGGPGRWFWMMPRGT
jgi:hypothetical protein